MRTATLILLCSLTTVQASDLKIVYLAKKRPLLVCLKILVHGKPFREAAADAQKKYLQALHRYLDVDQNGTLNQSEARRIPAPVLAVPGVGSEDLQFIHLAFNFRSVDENSDDKVTTEELEGFYRHFNRGITVSEQRTTQVSSVSNEIWFKYLDLNSDGALSKKELDQSDDLMNRLDVNEDELLSVQELGGAAVTTTPKSSRAHVIASEQVDVSRMTRSVRERYPRLHADLVAKLDRDRNQEVDRVELRGILNLKPDLSFIVRLGARKKNEPIVQLISGALRVKKRNRQELTSFIDDSILSFLINDNQLSTRSMKRLQELFREKFKIADRNNDGMLTRREAARISLIYRRFRLLDRDGDEKITDKEWQRWMRDVQPLQAQALASQLSVRTGRMGKSLWSLFDEARDKQISLRELRRARELFPILDRNGDGKLSASELPGSQRIALGLGQASFLRRGTQ